MTVLVTGAASGIGRYLAERFNADVVTRDRPVEMLGDVKSPYEAIIHCAFNIRRNIGLEQLPGYLNDTIGLTEAVVRMPHRAFVLMSSIDVYPDGAGPFDEQTRIDAFNPRNLYALCKMASEAVVVRQASNPLILRAGMLLGPHMRPNNLTRLINGDHGALTLTAGSSFHCVGYADIALVIEHALHTSVVGTFNAAHCPAVTMAEVAKRFGQDPAFGKFEYRAPAISNARLQQACPLFAGNSMAALDDFAALRK